MSGGAASLYTWRGGVGGEGKLSCHTGTIDAEWSAVKDFIPYWLCSKSRDLLYVKCWQWRYVNLHTHLQPKNDFNAEAPALKRKKEKACQHVPMKRVQNPQETRMLPNSAWRNVCFAFRFGENLFFLNVVGYEHSFRSAGRIGHSADCLLMACWRMLMVCSHLLALSSDNAKMAQVCFVSSKAHLEPKALHFQAANMGEPFDFWTGLPRRYSQPVIGFSCCQRSFNI